MARLQHPTGFVAALVGAILGGSAGVWVALIVFEQVEVGDLSDLGTGLLLLLAGLVIGPAVGATLGLAVRRHKRALVTGLLIAPFMLAAIVGGFALAQALPGVVVGLLGLPALIGLALSAIWLARKISVANVPD